MADLDAHGDAVAGALLDVLPLAVVVVGPDRRVSMLNPAAEALYGHPAPESVGSDVLELLFDADDHAGAAALFAGDGPRDWAGDRRVRRRDGTLLVSSFRLVPIGGGSVAWIATDGADQGVAEEQRSVLLSAEHAARATAEEALGLLEAILASAPVAIAVFDLDLRYVRVNDAYAALSGVRAAEHHGGRIGAVVGSAVGIETDLRRVLTSGRVLTGREVGLSSLEGGTRYFTVAYFPVRSVGGSLIGAGLAGVEITELKRAEAARAQSLEEAEAARRRLAVVATASTVLTTTMDVDDLLDRLARALVPAAADWCVVALHGLRSRPDHVAVAARRRDAAPEVESVLRSVSVAAGCAVAEVGRTGQPRLLGPATIGELWGSGRATGAVTSSSIVVPVDTRDGLRGVLVLATAEGRRLGDDDIELAVEVASRVGLAVGNARAFQQEHKIAETLQRALLPSTVPSLANVEIAVRYVAAADGASVGGDWYDVLPFDDGSATVVVGDVVGHDVAASTAMGQLRAALRAFAYEGPATPSSLLGRLERIFEPLGLTYATCVLGAFDSSGTSFRWSNAGHPPPLLVRERRATLLEDCAGLMLGVGEGGALAEATVELRAGDLLVLYTDGLVERRDEALGIGLSRLVAIAATLDPTLAPATICDRLVEALHPEAASLHDDVAILVARVGGAVPAADVHRLAFEPSPDAAAMLRGYTAGVLSGRGWDASMDTAVLLVSELATNVVRHAHGPCALVITFRDGLVELSVEDGDTRPPAPRMADPLDEGGRGLLLIEALAEEWGVRRLAGGKATWLTLRSGADDG